jgi:RNA recognition motif-containing protein
MTSIYVGNLPHSTTEDELREVFSQHGEVSSVNVVKDRETGRSRGFAFVEMPNGNEAANAIQQLNLQEIGGRSITVDQARPKRSDRPRKGGGGRRSW